MAEISIWVLIMSETIRTDYYVYAYLRQKDSKRGSAGTPYYIGKGTGYRIHQKSGHPFLPSPERRIKIAKDLTEQAALDLEMELIGKYGRIKYDEGGILYNISLGGEGYSIHRTEESREAARQAYLNSEKGIETTQRARKKRVERMRADTEDGRMRRKKKSESDRRYRENPKYKERLIQQKKEYYEKNKEEILAKEKAKRATPEGKAKKASMDKRYREEVVKKDPVKLERRRRMSRENAMKNSRLKGVKPKEECGRKFKVVSPEGKVYEGINCKPFAEEHGLSPTSFTAMCRGELNFCNGWTRYGWEVPEGYKIIKFKDSYRLDKINKVSKRSYSFKMIDPQGNVHEGFNQHEFGKKHGLDYKKVNAVLKGRINHTAGWIRA
tara:strand:- start:427 stop:1572 length:1146 start_codon:yes stop_codon:yes gene_type:complete